MAEHKIVKDGEGSSPESQSDPMGKHQKPFHLFEHRGFRCLINIEDMSAHAIDVHTAARIEPLKGGSGAEPETDTAELLKGFGLVGNGKPKKSKKASFDPIPVVNMALFLTQSCNLRCVYCYGDGGTYGTGGSMDQKTAFQAVDWLIEQSGKKKKIHVGFFGGEPFLAFPMMKAVTEYAKKKAGEADKAVDFNVTTNGTLLDDEKIAFVKEHDISVQVSFDGPREVQNAQRPFSDGGSSYDVAVPKIKKLLDACPKTNGHAVITGNMNPMHVKKALQDIGFAEVSFAPASASLLGKASTGAAPRRNLDDWVKLLEQEAETWIEHIRNRDGEFLKQFMSGSELYQFLLAFLHNTRKTVPCGAGFGLAGVSCAGDVYLCHRFVGMDDYRLGNVFSTQLNREQYQELPVTFVKECRECFAKWLCAGGCKHDNAGTNGSVFQPSGDTCRLMRRRCEMAAYTASLLTEEDRAFLIRHEIVPKKFCPLDL